MGAGRARGRRGQDGAAPSGDAWQRAGAQAAAQGVQPSEPYPNPDPNPDPNPSSNPNPNPNPNQAGSPIDAYTSFNETPLHLAVRNNRLGCVKLLVDAGASTAAEYGKNGDTALSLAQKYKFEPIIDYLKSKGAPGAVAGSKAADSEIDRGAPGFLPSLPCPKVLKAYLCN